MNSYPLDFSESTKKGLSVVPGTVEKIRFDVGYSLRVYDLNFATTVSLSKAREPEPSRLYLYFILSPDAVSLESIDQHVQYNSCRERHALLIPGLLSIQFRLRAHLPVQIIEFSMPVDWLQQMLMPHRSQALFAPLWNDPLYKTVSIEPGNVHTNALAEQLFQNARAVGADNSQLLEGSTELIVTVLEKIFLVRGAVSPVKDIYQSKMMEAEKILGRHLRNKLPHLSEIARQLAISESTLKRHFKVIYGKSIYEYYLARKMELAHQLLKQEYPTVNETAELMGYEKTSYFIEIFKKYYGYSPGEMLKRGRSD